MAADIVLTDGDVELIGDVKVNGTLTSAKTSIFSGDTWLVGPNLTLLSTEIDDLKLIKQDKINLLNELNFLRAEIYTLKLGMNALESKK